MFATRTLLSALASAISVAALPPLDPSAIATILLGLGPAPYGDTRYTDYTPPGPGDVRSPCPGLNTLANHNFIPHNGKGMTIPILLEGLASGMNMGADFTTVIGAAGLLSSPDPFGGSFDLDQLDQHNFPIEHDASNSRRDAYFGNDYSFYQPNWNMVLSHFKGDWTSIQTASDAKWARVNNSLTANPQVVYSAREFVFSYAEVGLYLQTMGQSTSGNTSVAYINSMFEKEKLPYAMGWRPSITPVTLTTLGEMALELDAANPNALPEGLELTVNSYKDLLELTIGGAEVLANLTQGISSALKL